MGDERQYLKHGKALCGKVFAKFVETFNWLVDFSTNLKGDGEGGGQGKVYVDRSDAGHPVIRCKGCQQSAASSDSGGGGSTYVDNSCFRMVDSNGSAVITCCYYNVGGITHKMNDFNVSAILPADPPGGENQDVTFICFKLTGSTPSIVAIDSADLAGEQKDESNYVMPLYKYSGTTLTDDLRNALNVQMWETGLVPHSNDSESQS